MLSTSPPPTVLCAGHCTLVTLGVVERMQPPGGEAELHQFTIQGGGAAATAGVMLAQLGAGVRFVGKVGDDERGALIGRTLSEAGVEVGDMVVERGAVSQFAFIIGERTTGLRQSWWTRGTVSSLEASEVAGVSLAGVSLVLLDGTHAGAQLALARAARASGVPVLLDARQVTSSSEALVRASSMVIASERFALEYSGAGQPQAALVRLRAQGPEVAVITLGDEGSVGQDAGGSYVQGPIHLEEEMDATGAGDIYRGAFAYGWLQGWGLAGSMRFATAAATLSLRSFGGRGALPTRGEVEALLGEGK